MAGRSECGVGLAEALIALALLAVALNGLLAAQWQARQLQQEATARHHAIQALQDFAARWRLNAAGESDYRRDLARPIPDSPSPHPCQWQACSPAARAQADLASLALQLRQDLVAPQWHLAACLDSASSCLLVAWAGTAASAGPNGSCLDASGQRVAQAHCVVLVLP